MTNFPLPSISRGIAALAGFLVAPLVLAQFSISPAVAADFDVGSMHISQPWARATPKGADDGAGYMTITNKGIDAGSRQSAYQTTPASNARSTA